MDNYEKINKDLDKIIKRTDIEGLNPKKSKDFIKISDLNKINILRRELGLDEIPTDVFWNEFKIYNIYKQEEIYLSAFLQKYKKYFQKISLNYLSILENESFEYVYMDRKEKISEKDAFDILNDFYNFIDIEKGNIIFNMIKEGKIIRKEPSSKFGYEGHCVNIDSEKYPYIISEYGENKLDLLSTMTLAHEFGHAIEFVYWKNRYKKSLYANNNMTIEISSLLFEHLFLEYIKNNHLFTKDYANIVGYQQYQIRDEARACDNLFADKINLGLSELNYLEGSCIFKDDIIHIYYYDEITTYHFEVDLSILDDMKYLIGQVFSYNFLSLYNNDPEKFNKKYNDFLSCRSLLTLEKAIEFWNFDKERFLNLTDAKPIIQDNARTYNNYLYKKKMQ